MTLDRYMDREGIRDGQLAELCGCDRTTILRARRGETLPSPSLMAKIAQVTGGEVQPNDFYARAA